MHPLLVKLALDVERGGIGSRILSGTLGRANPLTSPFLLLNPASYRSSAKGDRPKEYEEVGKAMERAAPDELKDVVLSLEGPNLIDDLIWKKNRNGENNPWYKRIGGRLWHNKNTTLPMKVLHTALYPLVEPISSLFRIPHYNYTTDRAVVYGHDLGIATNLLGRAIDLNEPTFKWKEPDKHRYVKQLANAAARDAYATISELPILNAWHHINAGIKGHRAIQKGTSEDARRWELLPVGYSSGNVIITKRVPRDLPVRLFYWKEKAKEQPKNEEKKEETPHKKAAAFAAALGAITAHASS